ncbi:MAG: FUSC family protein [Actinomycetota bacterium]
MASERPTIRRSLVQFDFSRAEWADAIRGTAVASVILVVLVAIGRMDLVLPVSIGAVFTAVAESGLPFGRRWRTMLWTTLWLMVAMALAVTISGSILLTIVLTVPVALVCGAVGYLGPRAAITGMLSLVVFAAYAGIPMQAAQAPSEALLMGLGGLIQTFACMVMGVIRHRGKIPPLDPVHHPSVRTLRTEQQAFLRHGIRLAILMVIATTVSELWSIPHAYWLPVAVAWMTKPDRNGTVTRVVQRVAGTALGVAIIGLPGWLLGTSSTFYVLFAIIGSTIAIAFIWVNYDVGVSGVTIWILAMIGFAHDPLDEDLALRLGLTVAAALLVYIGTFLWRLKPLH